MNTLPEIEEAIARLPAEAQRQLVKDIPALCPSAFPAVAWDTILQDETTRPALSSLLDRLDTEHAQAQHSAYDLVKDLIGKQTGGPGDLATNPKYMEGFGR